MTFTICCRFHDKFVCMLEDILLQVYSDLNGFHGQSIKCGGFDEVFFVPFDHNPTENPSKHQFHPCFIYVGVCNYQALSSTWSWISRFFGGGYTENSDAYLTNSERGIKGDKCLDTSKKRKNTDTWNYWCRNENWLLIFLVWDKVCSVEIEQWFLIRL